MALKVWEMGRVRESLREDWRRRDIAGSRKDEVNKGEDKVGAGLVMDACAFCLTR